MSERDTHFQGFAKLLWEDIIAKLVSLDLCIDASSPVWDRLEDYPSQLLRDGLDEIMQTFIAQCAYDLVMHTLHEIEIVDLVRLSTDEHVARIPDMTAIPPARERRTD